jgi:predicted GNAT superfamily acetyltransferase
MKEQRTLTVSSLASRQSPEITFRQLLTWEEYLECVELQKETWGKDFEECVPTSILKVSQKVGGIAAGAFDSNKRMLGFVFGITGIKNNEPAHWSHMLAVRAEARGIGLGKRLKLYQRELLLASGVNIAYWTYDPLVARNAQLNLNALGAKITEYVEDMYLDSSSDLHRGLGMDRFIVSWRLTDERVTEAIAGKLHPDPERFEQAPVVNTEFQEGQGVVPVDRELPGSRLVRVEIPSDIERIQATAMHLAGQWRLNTRRVFQWYLERTYSVVAFYIDSNSRRCFYCLEHQS